MSSSGSKSLRLRFFRCGHYECTFCYAHTLVGNYAMYYRTLRFQTTWATFLGMILLILKLDPQYFYIYRVSILGVIPQLGSRSKSRLAKFLSLTLTLKCLTQWSFHNPVLTLHALVTINITSLATIYVLPTEHLQLLSILYPCNT